jgi:hypothetical protein
MIVYVLFVHKKSVSKRKVCIIFIKNKNLKNQKNKTFLVGFLGGFLRFFGVGFLLPTLQQGPGERDAQRAAGHKSGGASGYHEGGAAGQD